MPVTKIQYDAVMQVARVNPGIKVDLDISTRKEIHLVNTKTEKRWMIDNKGGIHRV